MSGSRRTTRGGSTKGSHRGDPRRRPRTSVPRPPPPVTDTAPCESSQLRDEDIRLHDRLLDRDESALLECLDRFGHVVYCTSLIGSGDSAVAEAVTERVFVELWRRPEAFHSRRGPLVLQLVRATLRPSPE